MADIKISIAEQFAGIWTVRKLRRLKKPVDIDVIIKGEDGSPTIVTRTIDFDDLIRKCEWAVDRFLKNGKYSVIGNMFSTILWTLECRTAMTDGIRVFFNPIFANELITLGGNNYKAWCDSQKNAAKPPKFNPLDFKTFKLFLFVITHEVYHQLYRHVEQAQRKTETVNGKNHDLANESMDDEINRDIEIQWPEFKGATVESNGCWETDKYPVQIWSQIFDDKFKNGEQPNSSNPIIPPPVQPQQGGQGGMPQPKQKETHHRAPGSYKKGWEQALDDIKNGLIDPNTFTPLAVDTSKFDHEVMKTMYMVGEAAGSGTQNTSLLNQDEWNQGYNDCIQQWINQMNGGEGGEDAGGPKFDNLESPPSKGGKGKDKSDSSDSDTESEDSDSEDGQGSGNSGSKSSKKPKNKNRNTDADSDSDDGDGGSDGDEEDDWDDEDSDSGSSHNSSGGSSRQQKDISEMNGKQAAKAAQKEADKAQKAADKAQKAADKAQEKADKAQAKADKSGKAEDQAKADAAQAAADAAQEAADDAQNAADEAKAAASAAQDAADRGDDEGARQNAQSAQQSSDEARDSAEDAKEASKQAGGQRSSGGGSGEDDFDELDDDDYDFDDDGEFSDLNGDRDGDSDMDSDSQNGMSAQDAADMAQEAADDAQAAADAAKEKAAQSGNPRDKMMADQAQAAADAAQKAANEAQEAADNGDEDGAKQKMNEANRNADAAERFSGQKSNTGNNSNGSVGQQGNNGADSSDSGDSGDESGESGDSSSQGNSQNGSQNGQNNPKSGNQQNQDGEESDSSDAGKNDGSQGSGEGGSGDRDLNGDGDENNTKDQKIRVEISKKWGGNDMISKEDAQKIAEHEEDPYKGEEANKSAEDIAKKRIGQFEKQIREIGKGTAASMDRKLDDIASALKPPVNNWKGILKKHLRAAGDHRQFFKMDKRRIPVDRADWAEEEMPMKVTENNAADVFYLVDASGSISDRDLYRVFSEIVGNKGAGGIECSKDMKIRKSCFTYFADRVVDTCIRTWTIDDSRAKKLKLIQRTPEDSKCGFGTDIEGSVDHVVKLGKKYFSKSDPKTVLIVFTDAEDWGFEKIAAMSGSVRKEIIFCIMNNSARLQERCQAVADAGIPTKNIVAIDTSAL